ncbi:hypothetical protein GCM10010385_26630 [Streptomyces geysiriensis]|nr:hypothetical protein GCM10010385_26630 [Streptomyces geysiriensis]GGZ41763.1 hypothetical protein GCM10010301_12340 [Streptomyces plicatus]GHC26797.1 hypothetical protein GCM10010308_49580 [Streptomyces vinaceusdrappus]
MQVSHRTSAFWRSSSRVTVWSVVNATDAELSPPGSHAARPPTATTEPTTVHAVRQFRLNAPMEGSLPPVRYGR